MLKSLIFGVGYVERIFSSETYSIRDAVYYSTQSFTTNTVLSIPNIPVNFKALFTIVKDRTGSAWLEVGKDSNNLFFGGKTGRTALDIYKKVNGTQTSISNYVNAFPSNGTYPVELTYENGVITCKSNGYTVTGNYTLTDRDYVRVQCSTQTLKDLTILPL